MQEKKNLSSTIEKKLTSLRSNDYKRLMTEHFIGVTLPEVKKILQLHRILKSKRWKSVEQISVGL